MEIFNSESDLILAKSVKKHWNIKKGERVILKRINNQYYHPNNCYVDNLEGIWLGRFSVRDFEIIRHLEENEDVNGLKKKLEPEQHHEPEQLVLF